MDKIEAESEVARLRAENASLTEALAAAERKRDDWMARCYDADVQGMGWKDRAESAERDRDAANALLAIFERGMFGESPLRDRVRAHLSSQPAAPAERERDT